MNNFKKIFTFNQRQYFVNNLKKKYPFSIPIVIEMDDKCFDINYKKKYNKKKYKMFFIKEPFLWNTARLHHIIRKYLDINIKLPLYIFINDNPIKNDSLIYLYNNFNDDDGNLYIKYSNNNFIKKNNEIKIKKIDNNITDLSIRDGYLLL